MKRKEKIKESLHGALNAKEYVSQDDILKLDSLSEKYLPK